MLWPGSAVCLFTEEVIVLSEHLLVLQHYLQSWNYLPQAWDRGFVPASLLPASGTGTQASSVGYFNPSVIIKAERKKRKKMKELGNGGTNLPPDIISQRV